MTFGKDHNKLVSSYGNSSYVNKIHLLSPIGTYCGQHRTAVLHSAATTCLTCLNIFRRELKRLFCILPSYKPIHMAKVGGGGCGWDVIVGTACGATLKKTGARTHKAIDICQVTCEDCLNICKTSQ